MEYVLPVEIHDAIVVASYRKRGYTEDEAHKATYISQLAGWHGIKTHNALKALHLDDTLGSGHTQHRGCVPAAQIERLPSRFEACQRWNANRKIGPAVALEAMNTCMALADRYGVGIVSVDQCFHYLWGGGYVMEAAKKGYIAYTNCTSAKAEVVPYMGHYPTLGTNPHSWGFPTTQIIGFPIVIDWATSVIAMGRVSQLAREGKSLPPGAAVDDSGQPTTDPNAVAALLPFAAHKGYGLSLIDELVAAMIGGSLPTLRCLSTHNSGEKTTSTFFFQVICPEALDCGAFACARNQAQNVKAVIEDILGHGNDECLLPGQVEAEAAKRSESVEGLIFTEKEIAEFEQLAGEVGVSLGRTDLKTVA